jgi:hypothetical protein
VLADRAERAPREDLMADLGDAPPVDEPEKRAAWRAAAKAWQAIRTGRDRGRDHGWGRWRRWSPAQSLLCYINTEPYPPSADGLTDLRQQWAPRLEALGTELAHVRRQLQAGTTDDEQETSI